MTADIHMPFFSNINLDLIKTQAWVPQQIFATEGDNGYGQIFSLYENGNPYTSATVNNLNFRAIKPDSNVVDIKNGQGFKAIDGQSNQFAFQVPAQTFAATGRVECYFYVTNSENTIVASTTHFFYEVQRSVPSETGSVSYIASLEGIIAEANALKKQADDLVAGLTESKSNASTMVNDFQSDLVLKEQDIGKKADQMLADCKTALDKTTGAATDYQQKLDTLNKQYIQKYNELLAQLPNASDAVKKQISDALAQIKDDEQGEFQKISMDWVNKKQALDDSITTYKDSVTKELDALKQQIAGLSGDNVAQLSKQIDDLQTKLNNMHLADYYTKKEIDDKLADYQPSIDLSGYETTAHAEQTYAKKSDIVAPDLSGYETKTDAEQTYAKKTDIPAPADLSNYAKSADVAKTYETKADADNTYAKKTDIVAPDLSSYETSKHASDTYETKADAATHLTKTQADTDYATKDDLANAKPDLSGYAKTSDIPDVSGFETKTDAEATYAKKTDIPARPDLSGYETSEHASETYETKADAQSTYATKDDLKHAGTGSTPDLSDYLKKTDADKTYMSSLKIGSKFAGGYASDNVNYTNIWVNPRTQPESDGYVDASDGTKFAYPALVKVSTDNYKDPGNKTVLEASSNGAWEGYIFQEDDKLFLAGKRLLTNDDLKSTGSSSSTSSGSGSSAGTSTDLSQYLTKTDADSTYAKKSDVGSNGKFKSIQAYGIMNSSGNPATNWYGADDRGFVDMSDIIAKSVYDVSDVSLSGTINSLSSSNPKFIFKRSNNYYLGGGKLLTDSNTDLTKYATKDDLKNEGTGSSTAPDLSAYVKTADLEKDYVTKKSANNAFAKFAKNFYHSIYGFSDRALVTTANGKITGSYLNTATWTPNDMQLDLMTDGLVFPAVIDYDTDGAPDDNYKHVKRASESDPNVKNSYLYDENGKFFLRGKRLLTDEDDLSSISKPDLSQYLTTTTADATYAKKTDATNTVEAYKSNLTGHYFNGDSSIANDTDVAVAKNGTIDLTTVATPSIVTIDDSCDELYVTQTSKHRPNMIYAYKGNLYVNGKKLAFQN